jgi:uncharacterized protein with von Willebrand factor type A (vWA) domain
VVAPSSSGEPSGAFAANLVHFTRLLRRAGLPIGPGSTLDAVRAVEAVGVARKDDLYWALHAVLVTRPEQREIFHRAFHLFWRDPFGANEAMAALLPRMDAPDRERKKRAAERRVSEAAAPPVAAPRPPREPPVTEHDVVMSWSEREALRTRDFEQMSADEEESARRLIARMRLDVHQRTTRRWAADTRGARIDPRATLRASLRGGHGVIPLRWRSRVQRPDDLVVLCDISGSMERYARMMLHFLHALTRERARVSTFLFGTRLTNITRQLRHRDVDEALERVGRQAQDWSGGTRIGASLELFNRLWSRRVLGQGAVVLLITDGLDREGAHGIEREAASLRRSCRRLIWLNPLLRWEGFEPRAAGVRALLRHVDDFRPVHDLRSLEQLAEALSSGATRRRGAAARPVAP